MNSNYDNNLTAVAADQPVTSQVKYASADDQSKTNNTNASENGEATNSSDHEPIVHQTPATKKCNMNNRYNLWMETEKNGQRLTDFIDVDSFYILQSSKNLMATIDTSFEYINTPDEVFYQMLLKGFNNETQTLHHFLNENEQIPFIRRYTSLMSRVSYIKLQQLQWNWYYETGMTRNIWTGRIQKPVAAKNSICSTYGRSKTCIKKRLKKIQRQLQQAQNVLQLFERDILSKSSNRIDYSSKIRSLSSVMHRFIDKKQQKLRDLFEYDKQMLVFDANDHYLVQDFYRLKPSIRQTASARCLWQATAKQTMWEEQIAILERRLTSKPILSLETNLLDHMLNDIDQQLTNQLHRFNPIALNDPMSSFEFTRLEELKRDIIHQGINTARKMIEEYVKTAQTANEKFFIKKRKNEPPNEKHLSMKTAIQVRRLYMIQRAQTMAQYKLTAYFN